MKDYLEELFDDIQFEAQSLEEYYKMITYLSDKTNYYAIQERARELLIDDDRCIYCGGKLEHAITREVHTELEGNPSELIDEPYCPYCDFGGNDE